MPHETALNTWHTDQVYYVAIGKAAREHFQAYPMTPPYVRECFLSIQDRIEKAFIRESLSPSANKTAPATNMQRFAYPSISEDMFISLAGVIFPIVFVICMLLSMKNIIKVSDTFVQ